MSRRGRWQVLSITSVCTSAFRRAPLLFVEALDKSRDLGKGILNGHPVFLVVVIRDNLLLSAVRVDTLISPFELIPQRLHIDFAQAKNESLRLVATGLMRLSSRHPPMYQRRPIPTGTPHGVSD